MEPLESLVHFFVCRSAVEVDHVRRHWVGDRPAEGKADLVMIRCGDFLKDDDGGCDKGIAKLHVRRAISMDMKQLDVFGQVGLDGGAVIDVHEFRGNQPDGQAAGRHPGIAKQQEMGVKPGQAADVEAEAISDQRLQPLLCRPGPSDGAAHRAGWSGPGYRAGREKPARNRRHDPQAGGFPEGLGGGGEWRVDLHPASIGNGLRRERPAKSRVKRAAADGRIKK